MLEGKTVNIDEFERLKIFYPLYRIVRRIPLIGGKYIYVGKEEVNLDHYTEMIWVRKNGDIQLNTKESVVDFLGKMKKLSEKGKRSLMEREDEDFWNAVSLFYNFGIIKVEEVEESVYKLFMTLSRTDKEIYREFRKISVPYKILVSSILSMLIKAKEFEEYRGVVSKGYAKTLQTANRMLKDVRRKAIRYWLSDQTELQFLYFLFSLRR